ncbi:hypothetical protein MNEG_5209 [Monoraphidium neglectum]|uniref:Uncharacterized protein n=1 Tax=Monoraphidium neglectum TaxID=145388 RepID=A0A0D2MQP9_9CHLO|nr:hypothetical protein MNEG_5209 [Monoraphidium neglectum]KIZ02752.1 hypothetical protein MNEG_5209 [Monoraphidium neglectum]|eukprot:XP_013901771.1 hypothetical protein MNEG_5209 [Monoraphidium neglectum]
MITNALSVMVTILTHTAGLIAILEYVSEKAEKLMALLLRARNALRHASSITLEDLVQVEGSLKIWWAIAGEDDLGAEAITNLTDPTEHQWGENKLEAKQTEEYMQMLKDKAALITSG